MQTILGDYCLKLRELIREVRNCKTLAQENALINKERGQIRKYFNENNEQFRLRNIAKLVFINQLGFDTDFGQMESLKLITSDVYADKKLGYLALVSLFNERSEVLLLATNRIKIDLTSSMEYIVALALSSLAEICSADMCQDLSCHVAALVQKSSNYIMKKACLAATRIIRKVPALADDFKVQCAHIISSIEHHGTLLAATQLALVILSVQPALNAEFFLKKSNAVSFLAKKLKTLINSFALEYDCGGTSDPQLQCVILVFFRQLVMACPEIPIQVSVSNELSDILAQVASNITAAKNAGCAVLFEAVKTITAIQSGQALRALSIGVLAKFLQNKDPNSMYVSLNLFKSLILKERSHVQKQKQMILSCLSQNDPSIVKAALELVSRIADSDNAQQILEQLLQTLKSELGVGCAVREWLVVDLANEMCVIIEAYQMNNIQLSVDLSVQVFSCAGKHVKEAHVSHLLNRVSQAAPADKTYAVDKFYQAMRSHAPSQTALWEVALWLVGEYALLLPSFDAFAVIDTIQAHQTFLYQNKQSQQSQSNENNNTNENERVQEYALTCIVKLYAKCPSAKEALFAMLQHFTTHTHIEIQQRAREYTAIFGPQWQQHREALFEPMPPVSSHILCKKSEENQKMNNVNNNNNKTQQQGVASQSQNINLVDNLLDMDNLQADGGIVSQQSQIKKGTASPIIKSPSLRQNQLASPLAKQKNLLNEIDLLEGTTTSASINTTNAQQMTAKQQSFASSQSILDLYNVQSNVPTIQNIQTIQQQMQAQPNQHIYTHPIYSDEFLKVTFECQKSPVDPSITSICAIFESLKHPVTDIQFQVAVLKHLKLTLFQISSQHIEGKGGHVSQMLTIQNLMQGQKPIVIKIKLMFSVDVEEEGGFHKSVPVQAERTIQDFPDKF